MVGGGTTGALRSLPIQTIQGFCDLDHVYSCHWEHKCSVTLSVVQQMLAVLQHMETILNIKDGYKLFKIVSL